MNHLKVMRLREIARSQGLKGYSRLKKSDLISLIESNEREMEAQRLKIVEADRLRRREFKEKYFSRMTVKELRDFAKENNFRGHSSFGKKSELISFLDLQCQDSWRFRRVRAVRANLEKRFFPDTLRAWVRLFVSDKSVAEHYTQIILHTLSSVSFSERKRERECAPMRLADFEFIIHYPIYDDEDEDLPDGW